jgi:hypothetical protein
MSALKTETAADDVDGLAIARLMKERSGRPKALDADPDHCYATQVVDHDLISAPSSSRRSQKWSCELRLPKTNSANNEVSETIEFRRRNARTNASANFNLAYLSCTKKRSET